MICLTRSGEWTNDVNPAAGEIVLLMAREANTAETKGKPGRKPGPDPIEVICRFRLSPASRARLDQIVTQRIVQDPTGPAPSVSGLIRESIEHLLAFARKNPRTSLLDLVPDEGPSPSRMVRLAPSMMDELTRLLGQQRLLDPSRRPVPGRADLLRVAVQYYLQHLETQPDQVLLPFPSLQQGVSSDVDDDD